MNHHYIVDRRKIYSNKVNFCIWEIRVYGETKLKKFVDFVPPCDSDYCNICGLEKCRDKAKVMKVKHSGRPHHIHITLKFGDFQNLKLQQKCFESMKEAILYVDETALFSKVNQWLKGRRHMHIVMSSDLKWSRTKIKKIRDKYFKKYNIPFTSMATMGYAPAKVADGKIDYILRTGDSKDKPRWKRTEYPPVNVPWSLTRG